MNRPPLLWEQHCCLPLTPDVVIGDLARYRRRGGSFVSANAGYSLHSYQDVLDVIERFTQGVIADDRLLLVQTVEDVDRLASEDLVGVAFDLEDSGPLEGDLDRVRLLKARGVHTMLPTYNERNAAGSGCLDSEDGGLTEYGVDLIREMNRAGMVADGSHCSIRTGLDISRVTHVPMVYSHSCMNAVWEHPRNITDDQARACADTGGVIGITGVGIFLGANDASLQAMCRHLEYAVNLVGIDHVGLSTDYNFDYPDFLRQLEEHPELFPDSYTRWGPIEFVAPEELLVIDQALAAQGFSAVEIEAILGGNFSRVARQVWSG